MENQTEKRCTNEKCHNVHAPDKYCLCDSTSSTLDGAKEALKIIEPLYDADADATTIRIVKEKLTNYVDGLLSKKDAEIREMVEGMNPKHYPVSTIDEVYYQGFEDCKLELLAKLDNQNQ